MVNMVSPKKQHKENIHTDGNLLLSQSVAKPHLAQLAYDLTMLLDAKVSVDIFMHLKKSFPEIEQKHLEAYYHLLDLGIDEKPLSFRNKVQMRKFLRRQGKHRFISLHEKELCALQDDLERAGLIFQADVRKGKKKKYTRLPYYAALFTYNNKPMSHKEVQNILLSYLNSEPLSSFSTQEKDMLPSQIKQHSALELQTKCWQLLSDLHLNPGAFVVLNCNLRTKEVSQKEYDALIKQYEKEYGIKLNIGGKQNETNPSSNPKLG